MKSVGFGGLKPPEVVVDADKELPGDHVVKLAEAIFKVLGVPACLVFGEKKKLYREVLLNPDHPDYKQRYFVNAHLKHAAVSEEPDTDSPDLFRKTPIVFAKESGKLSCELEGGAGFGSLTAALSGLFGRCDRAVVSFILARHAGFEVRCLSEAKDVLLADGVTAKALQIVTNNYIDLVPFIERVCDMQTELTEGNERGIFVRTLKDPRPAPAFGFIIQK